MFPVTYFFFPKLTCRRGLTLRVLTGNLKPATRRWARCKPLNYGMASSTRESAPGTQTAQLPAFVHPFIRVHVTFSPMPRFKRPWIDRPRLLHRVSLIYAYAAGDQKRGRVMELKVDWSVEELARERWFSGEPFQPFGWKNLRRRSR